VWLRQALLVVFEHTFDHWIGSQAGQPMVHPSNQRSTGPLARGGLDPHLWLADLSPRSSSRR
jgi:hypothetical protein